MKVFKALNSNDMAFQVYSSLEQEGIVRDSRNGPVIMFPTPVTTIYCHPWERCNFTEGRDANPVFHHMEALWMLAGRQDVEFLAMFNSNMSLYSDDGKVFNAPYGHRIRNHFGHDQLEDVINILSNDPDSRQAVIQIWDEQDLMKNTKDKACNMLLVFSIDHEDKVRLTVYNRSNDLVYGGVTGANPVHMSYFQEYVSEQLGREMGELYFISNNGHVYTELYDHWQKMDWEDIYYKKSTRLEIGDLQEIEEFCSIVLCKEIITARFDSEMLNSLSVPMANYWIERKYNKDRTRAAYWRSQILPCDWRTAIYYMWDNRRQK